jgi:hypothetical protein
MGSGDENSSLISGFRLPGLQIVCVVDVIHRSGAGTGAWDDGPQGTIASVGRFEYAPL